ncbi:MAG: glutamate--tRNA ligase [Nanoarchaeota archaeon]|nr:glutamate--tRNA ligase [Nanoarchaeota archaeon]
MKDFEKKARAYALKNALSHDGKAQQGSVISALFNEGLKKSEVGKYAKKISDIVKEVNSISLEEQRGEFEKSDGLISERERREGLPELPGAKKGKVIMRIAPAASGVLHIGHALTSCISFLLVKEYDGKMYVRIEDTNPDEVFSPAYKMFVEDFKWLFDNYKHLEFIIQSERMNLYYDYAEKIIKKGFAYVCTCSSEDFKVFVEDKKNCPCRALSIKENLSRWKNMLDKKGYKIGQAVLRFKSDMKHKNPAMRDFPLARINETPHPLQKKKYRVWPLMNLSVSVDDIETKITHVIRGKDHRDNAEKQKLVFNSLGAEKKFPWTAFLGRYKFKDIVLSKRKMKKAVEEGEYSGWDDPDLPTLISLRKQGYKPQAFWKFAEVRGLSESDRLIDRKDFFSLLDSFNKLPTDKR